MHPSDLDLLRTLSPPALSPDGTRVVIAVTRPDQRADAYVGQLWEVPADGSAPGRRLTRGFADAAPRFSPDGNLLAFLRTAPQGRPQLHVVRAGGGEPLALTDQPLGGQPWPGRRTAVGWCSSPGCPRPAATAPSRGSRPTPSRRAGSPTRYLANGLGHVVDRRAQLFALDVPDVDEEPFVPAVPSAEQPTPDPGSGLPEPVQLTFDDADHVQPEFAPDGRSVTFLAESHDGRSEVLRSAAHRLSLGDDATPGEQTEVTGPAQGLFVDDVLHGPAGTFVLARAIDPDSADFVARNAALYRVDEPGGLPQRLTDPATVDLTDSPLVPHGDAVLVQQTTRGTVQLLAVTRAGDVRPLTTGPLVVQGSDSGVDVVALTLADQSSTGDVAVLADGGGLRGSPTSPPRSGPPAPCCRRSSS